MSRTGKTKKRSVEPDPIYGNKLLAKFINSMMYHGKKSTAQRLMYRALEIIKSNNPDPLNVFQTAVANVGPKMEVKSRRVGGASYQVPTEVRGERRISLAIKWIIMAANARSNKQYRTFDKKLAAELLDAYNNTGESIKKREIMQRNAEANRAFAHFRW